MAERCVVAIGGNALANPHDIQDLARQQQRADEIAPALADLLQQGTRLAIVHGNGPQVGGRLLQNEAASEVPASPLSVCVAETQGQIGHYLEMALLKELGHRGLTIPVASIVTHVLVDIDAPEFARPDKPVGPVYSSEESRQRQRDHGWQMAEVPGGSRRVVPSPLPLRIIEQQGIDALLDAGMCVIAGGGGGVPVVAGPGGLTSVDAVVDKDYTAELLATASNSARLVILTDVPGVALQFGRPGQVYLEELTAAEARHYLDAGEFPPGSMGPKVEACLAFLQHGGLEVRIASITQAPAAFADRSGTRILR